MDMLVSIHVIWKVTCQFPEKSDLGPELQLHLRRKTVKPKQLIAAKVSTMNNNIKHCSFSRELSVFFG